MKSIFFAILLCIFSSSLAQDLKTQATGMKEYDELMDPAAASPEEWTGTGNNVNVSYASDNTRYPKGKVPGVNSRSWRTTAWRGEKVHTQILVWSGRKVAGVNISVSDLSDSSGNRIKKENIRADFVRYVMTDEFGEGCDERSPQKYDSSLVGDPIDIIGEIDIQPNTVQPVWLSVRVPGNAIPGRYAGTITVSASGKHDLRITVEVSRRQLPPPEQTWISWYAAAQGFTGYLRWAYNNWTESVLQDTRYKTWPAGDCYQVYPGPRSSIRFEKLIEGIQDYEKLRILRDEFTGSGRNEDLAALDKILSIFTEENLEKMPAEDMVSQGKDFLNRYQ